MSIENYTVRLYKVQTYGQTRKRERVWLGGTRNAASHQSLKRMKVSVWGGSGY